MAPINSHNQYKPLRARDSSKDANGEIDSLKLQVTQQTDSLKQKDSEIKAELDKQNAERELLIQQLKLSDDARIKEEEQVKQLTTEVQELNGKAASIEEHRKDAETQVTVLKQEIKDINRTSQGDENSSRVARTGRYC